MDPTALKVALSDPSLTSLTDDQVQALPGFGSPILTPKASRVTYTTLAAVWGTTAAATFQSAIVQAIAANNPFSPVARFIDVLLAGPGIDPSDPQVPTVGAQFVSAGLATSDQFNGVFFDSSFKAGSATQTSDITEARAFLAKLAAGDALIQQVTGLAATFANEQVNPAISGSGSLPTLADFKTLVNAAN